MRIRLAGGLLLLLLPCGTARAEGAKRLAEPRVDPLNVRQVDETAVVSFRVKGGLPAEALDRIRSGLPVTHSHRVELLGRRAVPLWTAKVLGRVHIDTRAAYDSLTRRFELTRVIRVGPRKKKASVVAEERHSTNSDEEVRAWMTAFAGLPALDLPETIPLARLRVRVESTLGRRFVLYMFPSKLTVAAERKLEP